MKRVRLASQMLQALFLAVLPVSALHADVNYQEEYTKRIKFRDTVQPLGPSPFGEQVNLLTGEITFRQTDVSSEGTGLPITLERFIERYDRSGIFPSEFGSWAIAVPEIRTIVANTTLNGTASGYWRVNSGAGYTESRCTQIAAGMWSPPWQFYGPKSGGLDAGDWWRGYQLNIPGSGSQEVLIRADGNTIQPTSGAYPAVTTSHWQIGCLPTTSNQQPGEGFLVIDPNGTKYYLDHLDFAPYETYILQDSIDYRQFQKQPRALARMRASKVVDRFGNTVFYNYDGDRLASISSSDGRLISITWRTDAPLVDKVTSYGNSWSYAYTGLGTSAPSLSGITQPDGSTWAFSGSMGNVYVEPVQVAGCFPNLQVFGASSTGIDGVSTIKHPSGLVGTFRFSRRLHAQSYAITECVAPASGDAYENGNPYYMSLALVEKELSGPGLGAKLWVYQYEPAHASADRECGNNQCQGTAYTEVTAPDQVVTKYTHSTRMDALDGKLVQVEVRNGSGPNEKVDTLEYSLPAGSRPYPSPIGSSSGVGNVYAIENNVPLRKRTTVQDGTRFIWEVPASCGSGSTLCFDQFGRPTKTVRTGDAP